MKVTINEVQKMEFGFVAREGKELATAVVLADQVAVEAHRGAVVVKHHLSYLKGQEVGVKAAAAAAAIRCTGFDAMIMDAVRGKAALAKDISTLVDRLAEVTAGLTIEQYEDIYITLTRRDESTYELSGENLWQFETALLWRERKAQLRLERKALNATKAATYQELKAAQSAVSEAEWLSTRTNLRNRRIVGNVPTYEELMEQCRKSQGLFKLRDRLC